MLGVCTSERHQKYEHVFVGRVRVRIRVRVSVSVSVRVRV